MQYRNEKHRKEFEDAVRKCDKNKFALLSALYLLTADSKLWNLSKRFVKKNNIDFNSIYSVCLYLCCIYLLQVRR